MRGLVLLLVVSAALAAPQSGPRTSVSRACHEVLKSVEELAGNKATMDKCIAEQTGLNALLAELRASSSATGPHKDFPTILLAAAGKTAETARLRMCIARENKQLITSADGSTVFDVTKFKADLATKVAGTSSEANTTLGLNNCSTAPLQTFELFKYMGCIKSYCATGAAPAQ